MITKQTVVGDKVWFLEGAHLRSGNICAAVDNEICVRCGSRLVIRSRNDAWSSEATAIRSQSERLTNHIAVLENQRTIALSRLAELAGPIERQLMRSAGECCA